jgi:hypothetical protein
MISYSTHIQRRGDYIRTKFIGGHSCNSAHGIILASIFCRFLQTSNYLFSIYWGMAPLVELLPSKCEALSSIPSTTKRR